MCGNVKLQLYVCGGVTFSVWSLIDVGCSRPDIEYATSLMDQCSECNPAREYYGWDAAWGCSIQSHFLHLKPLPHRAWQV